jgi:hypothetical protein
VVIDEQWRRTLERAALRLVHLERLAPDIFDRADLLGTLRVRSARGKNCGPGRGVEKRTAIDGAMVALFFELLAHGGASFALL